MAELPEHLDRAANVELRGRNREPWIRRAVLLLLLAFCSAGLANVFGQKTGSAGAAGPEAELELVAPAASRGGLLYEATFVVRARADLTEPALVLEAGWFDGLTINTVAPEPTEWERREEALALVYDALPAGDELVARLQVQVNPTSIGGRSQEVVLEDGGETLVRVEHDMTIYP